MTLGDGDAAGGVTSHDPPHQLLVGCIEEAEFDRDAERSCGLALLVALRARPETPFEDNRDSQREEPLREFPKFRFSLTWKASSNGSMSNADSHSSGLSRTAP